MMSSTDYSHNFDKTTKTRQRPEEQENVEKQTNSFIYYDFSFFSHFSSRSKFDYKNIKGKRRVK